MTSEATEKIMFIESDEEILKLCQNYCVSNHVKDWNNLSLIKYIGHKYYFDYSKNINNKMSTILSMFWEEKAVKGSEARIVRKKAEVLNNCVDGVIKSVPYHFLLKENIKKQNDSLYDLNISRSLTMDKLYRNQQQQKGKQQQASHRQRRKRDNNDDCDRPAKKHLSPETMSALKAYEQLKKYTNSWSTNGMTLYLRSEFGIIPQRSEALFAQMEREMTFPLSLTATKEELHILKKISKSDNIGTLSEIADKIPSTSASPKIRYIKLALTKLCFLYQTDAIKVDHNEDYYRINVFGDILDSIFINDKEFNNKRSECHFSMIKALKAMKLLPENHPNVKLDFIVEALDDGDKLGDLFIGEDKGKLGTNALLMKDQTKGDFCRIQFLKYWFSLIPPYIKIPYLETISYQTHCLEFNIFGTTMLSSGEIIHYNKHTISVPKNPSSGIRIGNLLLTMISLKRNIIKNNRRIQKVFEIIQKDAVEFLESCPGIRQTPQLLRSDSTSTSQESNSNSSQGSNSNVSHGSGSSRESNSSQRLNISSFVSLLLRNENDNSKTEDWMGEERKRRINQEIVDELNNISFGDDVLTGDNWEELFFGVDN